MRVRGLFAAMVAASLFCSVASAAPIAKGPAYTWGANTYGQLGLGYTSNDQVTPTKIAGLGQVRAVAAGQRHTLVVRKDGTVWAFGDDREGQLGNGTTTASASPVQSAGISNVIAVAAGWDHSLALRSDGTVWAWGGDYYGQLGDGSTANESVPVEVPGLTGVTAVAAGGTQSFALDADGTLWAWGGNDWGQLGDGTLTNHFTPEPVLTSVIAVSTGQAHTLAVRTDGSVWGWGADFDDQLAYVPDPSDPHPAQRAPTQIGGITAAAAVAAGYDHSLALLRDGSVLAWGDNSYGQLGNGTFGGLFATPAAVGGLHGITAIAAGWIHSMALGSNGHAFTWGSDGYGQLGDGAPDWAQAIPVELAQNGFSGIAAGEGHSIGY